MKINSWKNNVFSSHNLHISFSKILLENLPLKMFFDIASARQRKED
jgi:hypothetical protein